MEASGSGVIIPRLDRGPDAPCPIGVNAARFSVGTAEGGGVLVNAVGVALNLEPLRNPGSGSFLTPIFAA